MPRHHRHVASEPAPRQRVSDLLERWQTGRDVAAFETLVATIRGPLQRIVVRVLRGCGVRDPAACEEAVALVLDRLRRLGEAELAAFDASRGPGPGVRDPDADPGWAYVCCMAASRSRDVARAVRRQGRRFRTFDSVRPPERSSPAFEEWFAEDCTAATDRIRTALDSLDSRSRTVIALLLEGKNQAVIAHVLGVCEGTVSRVRSRAIATLRELISG